MEKKCLQSSQVQPPETVKKAKKDCRDKVESSYCSFDTRRLWKGLRCITDYKNENTANVHPTATLADELNFDADNKESRSCILRWAGRLEL